ncbi:MAG: ATP-binding protein [Rhodospirillales bacterium]|jgi:signal transduction histidine kinase|nr:ATP-binding protein [Rhodospirillales bacterium]MDP6883963.1 ATP-binding protein [Rhodospirillales bacterium]
MLSDIRAGRATRLEDPLPVEVAPLAGEVNALLDHNATAIERARTQADDLAHALKTPLTVLTNEAARIKGGTGDVIRQQTALMNERVGHHLSRARAAGPRVLGARTKVGPVVERLSRTLRRIFAHRRIDIALNGTEELDFQGEHQDLEEMLGNLMENGCKWSRQRVRVGAERRNGALTLIVEDDGPGIPEALRSRVLDRGQRLDESAPGNGIGLSIVREMAEMYGGELVLGCSPLGGLEARLRLPAAPKSPTAGGL